MEGIKNCSKGSEILFSAEEIGLSSKSKVSLVQGCLASQFFFAKMKSLTKITNSVQGTYREISKRV